MRIWFYPVCSTIMSFLNKLAGRKTTDDTQPDNVDAETQVVTNDKETGGVYPNDTTADSHSDDNAPTKDAQRGVQEIEAVTLVWTKLHLVCLLCL